MDKQIKVSIIIPTYNRPKFLARALKSVDEQTFRDYEIIVVNDGGVDVGKIVSMFANTTYIKHDKNKWLSAARNTGIMASKGKYILFLDDDDYIMPEHLQILVTELDKGAKLAYTDYCVLENNETTIRKMTARSHPFDIKELYDHCLFPPHCAMIRRELFDGCMFDETITSHEDWDLWLRMSKKTNFVHIPSYSAIYSKRAGSNQLSNEKNHLEKYKEMKAKWQKNQ